MERKIKLLIVDDESQIRATYGEFFCAVEVLSG